MPVWINEFHYDNSTTNDPGEFVEIAGTAGTDLTGWSIVLYNGSGGASYSTRALSGTIPDHGNGFGTVFLTYAATGGAIQNGAPDGIALVNGTTVIQFLSYEGTFMATTGPAINMTSTDVGVAETNSTPAGSSLGLVGSGDDYSDFTWAVLSDDTPGGANVGQTFVSSGGGEAQTIQFNPTSLTIAEGNSGATLYTFTVTRTGGTTGSVDFSGTIAQGTTDAADFSGGVVPTTFSGTILAGQASATVTVSINGDNVIESNESFQLTITSATTAAAGVTPTIGANATATGNITNDDTPVISIADVVATEGNSGTKIFAFTVQLDRPAPFGGVTFDIATANASAAAGSDYDAASVTGHTILEGQTTYTFNVTVNGDTAIEPDEAFLVNITNVVNASVPDPQAQGTIQNDDSSTATVADVAIVEGNSGVKYLVFTVTLDNPPSGAVTIDYSTVNGTATAGSDYVAMAGTLGFAAGETVKTVAVPIVGDTVPESTETFTLTLSNATGATIGDSAATGTITNDDGTTYFPLANANFGQDWSNTGLITADDNWSNVPFIIGYLGDVSAGTTADVDPTSAAHQGPALGAVDVLANQTNPSAAGSGGVAEFQPHADPALSFVPNPTIALQGSGTADAPSIVLYMDSTGRSDVRLQATLRDLDYNADNASQQINVQYRTDPTGNWINVPGGHFTDVTTGGSATQTTALDVVLPAGANNAPRLEIRIMTVNAGSTDEWVGIDDIVVSSQASTPALSIADTAAFEGTGGTSNIVFTVTRAGDTTGASTADWTVSFAGGGLSASSADFTGAQPLTGTVSFAAGEATQTIVLALATDSNPEADEAFTVTLSNPSAGTTIADSSALGTIVNDDGAPPLLTITDVTQAEGNAGSTVFTFTVTRTGGSGAFTVDYSTADGSATAASGDYAATSGTLTFAAGDNEETIPVTVNGDGAGEFDETFSVLLSNATGFAVIADPAGTGTIANDDPLYIHQIQGSAYYSPILAAEGKTAFNVASTATVIVRAIVTAVDNDGERQGFYITEETGDWDSDWLTSEGIFVMTRDDHPSTNDGAPVSGVNVGDLVTVTARVMEYQAFDTLPRTMLVNPSFIVESTGNTPPVLTLDASRPIPNSIMTLVTPDFTSATGATFDATRYALSFWETVEGMLVRIPDMVVASGHVETSGGQPYFQAYSRVHADADQINSRGGYTIAGDPPASPPDTADADDDTIAGGRHLHDGDTNPDLVEIDFTGFAIDAPAGIKEQLSMGDGLGDVTGIVEFDFTDRKLFVTGWDQAQFVNTQPARETTALGSDSRSLTVATFNVENLDAAEGQARFDALAEVIATNLRAPDIVIVEEIQDNNGADSSGGADASQTWQKLVDALNARVPGAAYQWVDQAPVDGDEGGQPGGNIRVGFLYNTVRVQLGDLPADASIEDRRKYTDRIGDGVRDAGDLIQFSDDQIAAQINSSDWSSTRLPLLAQFTFSGNTVFLVGNHFTAKGGSGDFWQFDQNLAAGEPENAGWAKRNQQALDVYAMLDHIQTNSAGAGIVSGGDYNDFYFYRPLEVVTGYVLPDGTPRVGGSRFDNLLLTLSEAERYTYTFDGRSQALDHVVANSMLSAVATYDVVHVNTGYSAIGTGADIDRSLSDHDPALASFDFRSLSEILAGTSGRDVFRVEQGGDDRVSGLAGNDTFYFGGEFDENDFVDGDGGVDSIILDGDYSLGVTLGTGTTSNIVGIETISLVPASFSDYDGSTAGAHSYDIETLNSNVEPGAILKVNGFWLAPGENFEFDGSAETDGKFILLAGQGVDDLEGGAGNDIFAFGHDGRFGPGDEVEGGGGYDSVYLRGDYSIDFNHADYADSLESIESVTLGGFNDIQFTAGGDGEFDYTIVWNDALLAGGTITFNGSGLGAEEKMSFDGSTEATASFRLFAGDADDLLRGGGGADYIYGGEGPDTMTGGGGNDVFAYYSETESTYAALDGIGDFTLGDLIDLSVIDADVNTPGNQAFTFVTGAFTGPGQVRVTQTGGIAFVEANTNGDALADLAISVVVADSHPLTANDFIL